MLKHLKRRKLINPFSIFLVLIIAFLFSYSENSFSQLPQCAKLIPTDTTTGYYNLSNAYIDTCNNNEIYTKGKFIIGFYVQPFININNDSIIMCLILIQICQN